MDKKSLCAEDQLIGVSLSEWGGVLGDAAQGSETATAWRVVLLRGGGLVLILAPIHIPPSKPPSHWQKCMWLALSEPHISHILIPPRAPLEAFILLTPCPTLPDCPSLCKRTKYAQQLDAK